MGADMLTGHERFAVLWTIQTNA